MSIINSFVNRNFTDVVSEMNGTVLQEIVVPNRKTKVTLVGVVDEKDDLVTLHVFGVRKEDGAVTTRFDTPHTVRLQSTTLYKGGYANPEKAVRFERSQIRRAVQGRIARNFFRKVVRMPEFQEQGMAFYQTLKEPTFYLALCIELDTLNQVDPAKRIHEVVFPELANTVRFDLGKESHTARRILRYNETSKLVSAEYRFYTGPHWRIHALRGAIYTDKLAVGELATGLAVATAYANGEWEKAQEFVNRHLTLIQAFFTASREATE